VKNILLLLLLLSLRSGPSLPAAPQGEALSGKPYEDVANTIITGGLATGRAYEMLSELTGSMGARPSGSPQANRAILWARQKMFDMGFDSVWLEKLMVPHWVRGPVEEAYIEPMGAGGRIPLKICALGGSVATPGGTLTAEVVEVGPMVDAYYETQPVASALRRGNFAARMRMAVLYDRSVTWGGLVVGTGNKTEGLIGYTTLFGDSASAFNPIGDLYKSQVRQLAAAIGVPEQIIVKAPSADLWPGQTDEGEAGFWYPQLDRLLFWRIDERRSAEELVAMGFDPAFVERVDRMVAGSEFKRQLAPTAKMGHLMFGADDGPNDGPNDGLSRGADDGPDRQRLPGSSPS